jgi:phosphoribosylformimino-5-aminoimidazole carboxamide ribotide isomerase
MLECVLGVIDLRAEKAVHAVAGCRERYQKVVCQWTSQGEPLALADGYRQIGTGGLYVADLDAILGETPQHTVVAQLAQRGLPLWLDGGFRSLAEARAACAQLGNLAGRPAEAVQPVQPVIGTETCLGWEEIASEEGSAGPLTVSLDLRGGTVLAADPALKRLSPRQAAARLIAAGVRQLLVLDLAAVGTRGGGTTLELCRQLADAHPAVVLWGGGGVRDAADLLRWRQAGCRQVLVGTALHGGNLHGNH